MGSGVIIMESPGPGWRWWSRGSSRHFGMIVSLKECLMRNLISPGSCLRWPHPLRGSTWAETDCQVGWGNFHLKSQGKGDSMLRKLKKVWRIDLFHIYLYCSHLEINLWIQDDGAQFLRVYQIGLKSLVEKSGMSTNQPSWDGERPCSGSWEWPPNQKPKGRYGKGNGSIAPVRAKEWTHQPGRAIDLNHRSNQPQISFPKTIKGAKGHQSKDQMN